ncbi:MAG TPA: family 20 glycosylhydrolase, partial [Telluria sp.]|nr:family 20 glycosylhydrolase [Telluria sp.]
MPTTGLGQGHAAPVAVLWECLSNFHGDEVFRARLALRNTSGRPIAPGWAVYFNTCRKVVPGSVTQGYALEHVNGDLFRLTETGPPRQWLPGDVRTLHYAASFWAISHTDAPLGFYLVPGDDAPALDLGDPEIVPFTRAEQLHRHAGDRVPPADAAARFEDNLGLALQPANEVGRITPRPVFAELIDVPCALGGDANITHDPALENEAALLRTMLGAASTGREGAVVLELGPVEVPGVPASGEAYLLDAQPGLVRIRGVTPHGVFNGIQTLGQLLDPETGELPAGRVLDAPRFPYRGMMLDVARHFADVETVMRLLDCMARYKLNRFHFHLTDDEGWRLAISALPELTEVGARRGVGGDAQPCLPPSFGSGPDTERAGGSGFYTAGDFIAILRYAHARHIEVIPEFNLPGHARAAVVAMRVRYERLMAQGRPEEAGRYLLSDPDDASQYESVQLWHDNVICIALPSVDRFIDTVVAEVKSLYERAGVPLRTVHTGGDEVPAGAWLGSPLCRARMREHGWTDVEQLREDF